MPKPGTPRSPASWKSWPPEAKSRLRWRLQARPEQLTPPGDWFCWLYMAGRGAGKTRAGAEDAAWFALTNPGARVAVVAETLTDARDVCFEGESGLLRVIPRSCVADWNRGLGDLTLRLRNGSIIRGYSGAKPDKLRGPQHHRAWCDELAKWPYVREAWDNLCLGLRLGSDPRVVVTTTPKPISLLRELVGRAGADVHLTRGRTYDNLPNLAPTFARWVLSRYEGTRLGRQELEGELLDELPGALWTRARLEALRREGAPALRRVVIGVDPPGSEDPEAAECGIVVVGLSDGPCPCGPRDGAAHAFVLADLSMRGSPDAWGRRVAEAWRAWGADRVVVERNFGGDMVAYVLRTVDAAIPIREVVASRGKLVRAEPVAALYEQGRVHHVRTAGLEVLEDQMVGWAPGDPSPDRLDACVWALTDLCLGSPTPKVARAIRLGGRR